MNTNSFTTECEQREQVILDFLHLVQYTVGRMAIHLPSFVDKEALVETGIAELTLVFDDNHEKPKAKGSSSKIYVYVRVKKAILNQVRSTCIFSWELECQLKKLKGVFYEFLETHKRLPSLPELTNAMNNSLEHLGELLTALRTKIMVSDNRDWQWGKGAFDLLSMIKVPKRNIPEDRAEEKKWRAKVADALEELPEQERKVIVLYYYKGLLVPEISHLLGISKSRISSLHSLALYRLNLTVRKAYLPSDSILKTINLSKISRGGVGK